MAVTKEDLQRATSIMGRIIRELGHPSDATTDLEDEEITSLQALQSTLDVVESPLFSALVDIRDQCKKAVQASENWNKAADVRGTDTADIVAQFKERYNISSTASASRDDFMDDTSVSTEDSPHKKSESLTPSQLPLLSRLSRDYGCTLNKELERTPSVSSTDSHNSRGSKKKVGKKQAGGRGITLGSLARDPAQVSVIPLKTFQGEELTHRRDSEVSFSSISSEASLPPHPPTSPPHAFPTAPLLSAITVPPNKEGELKVRDVSERKIPKDQLYPMRDQKSIVELRATLNGKWGRERRHVVLPHYSTCGSTGLELCGLTHTGVFVAAVTDPSLDDKLQIGDQILEVDEYIVDNMAWFEVSHIMKSVDERGIQRRTHSQYELAVMNEWDIDEEEGYSTTYELVVQYNPAGMGEAKRQESKSKN